MKDKAELLNMYKFEELGGHVYFQIKRLYTDEGSEFMGLFAQNIYIYIYIYIYCDSDRTPVQRGGLKLERFNHTLQKLMEKEMKLGGKRAQKYISFLLLWICTIAT